MKITVILSLIVIATGIYFLIKMYLEEKGKPHKDTFFPYDYILLKDGELVSLLMWSDKFFVCKLTDGNIEYRPWSVFKANITAKKRQVLVGCEKNLKRLNIELPFIAKKVNTPDDSIDKFLKNMQDGADKPIQNNVSNEYLDTLNEEQLEDLKIKLEEDSEYEKLATLRDYMIIRQTKKRGAS